jgi:hypothetical protein
MEGEGYQELEDRRRLLRLLYDELRAARDRGEPHLLLWVSEIAGAAGLSRGDLPKQNSIGEELGMSGADTVDLFGRIRDRYLIGRLRNPNPAVGLFRVRLEDLSDEGMKTIGVLPRDQLINAFQEVIEAAQDPETPGTEQQKRAAIDWANTGIALARKIAWLADKMKEGLL